MMTCKCWRLGKSRSSLPGVLYKKQACNNAAEFIGKLVVFDTDVFRSIL